MPIALYVLGLTVFGLGTTEFMVVGLLPEIAKAFAISVPSAGLIISLFALGVTVGAPTVTLLSTRLPRKATLVALLVLFLIGEVTAANAPSYGVLLVARIITAVAHGAFFGIGAVVAAGFVGPEKRARAIAIMFGGLTVATVAGVPMGTFLGQQFGWRAPFWAIAVVGLIALVGVSTLVPHQPRSEGFGIRHELAGLRGTSVWLALATTMLSQAALYSTYAYIAPLLTEITGFGGAVVPPLLVLFGVGTFGGSFLGGRLADRNLMRTLCFGMVFLCATLLLFSATAHAKPLMIAGILVFGIAGFLINPGLQTRVLNEAKTAPTLASAANISAFNIGNAAGPWLAGLTISAGFGYLSPSWVGSALAGCALVTALLGAARDAAARRNVEVGRSARELSRTPTKG